MSRRSIAYTSSPLLASRTPVWRSKFIVAAIALGFVGLAARAVYIQVIANDFFQKQGEVRFARTLELPSNRGRILDRNGLILASSVPAPSIWAIPEDVERDATQLKQLAKLLEMSMPELNKRLEDEDKSFVWLKRQVDESVAQEITALGMKGIYQRKEYKRQYPEGEAAAHVVGFTNVEDKGQEGIELAFNKELAGHNGSRRVIKNRLGQVVEDVGEQIAPVDGPDLQLSIDSKVQFFAYQKLRDAVQVNKAKAGSVVVLDAVTGTVTGTPSASQTASNVVFGVLDANFAEASTTSTVSFTVAALTTGYVYEGELTWMPVSSSIYTYAAAVTLCSGTINGLTGWRLPTETELSALYTAYPSNSSVLLGQGWTLDYTWSSTPYSTGTHYYVSLYNGNVSPDYDTFSTYVTCVR